MESRGRYADQITTGMWVQTWAADFRQVERDPETDALGFITFHFTDGTATTVWAGDALATRDEEV